MATDDKLRNLDEHENLVLGTATGVVEQVMVQPVLFWKNSFQQGLPFSMNPKVVYRGTAASCCCMASLTGIQFTTSGFFQKLITGSKDEKMSWGQEVSCAYLGGFVSGPACCMWELTMIQQQRFGGSLPGTMRRIVTEFGPLGLTRGLVGSSGREAIFCAGYLGSVPATQKYVREHVTGVNPLLAESAGTIVASMVCTAISQPFDTAKTCMQGDLERKRYGGFWETLVTLHREYGGVRGFYRGYWWRCANLVLDFFLIDLVAKGIAPMLYPEKFAK